MTIQSAKLTNHLLDLIQNLGANNNRGETKASSSKADSFESMFKEYASTSHQPTSREETEASEVSPDYYKDKKSAEDSLSAQKDVTKNTSKKNSASETDHSSTSRDSSDQDTRDQKNAELRDVQKNKEESSSSQDQDTSSKDKAEDPVSKTDKTENKKSEKTEAKEETNSTSSTEEVSEKDSEPTDKETVQSLKDLLQQILDLLNAYTSQNGKIQATDTKELTAKLETLFQKDQFSEFWNKFKSLTSSSSSDNAKGQDKLTLMLEQMLENSGSSETSSQNGDIYKEIENIVSLLKNNKETLKNIFPSQNTASEQNPASKEFLQSLENLTKQIESRNNSAAELTQETSPTSQKIQTTESPLKDLSEASQNTEKTTQPLTKNSTLLKPLEDEAGSSENKKAAQETPLLNSISKNSENKPILEQVVQKMTQNESSKIETEAVAQSVTNKNFTDLSKTGPAETTQNLSETTSEIKTGSSESSQQNNPQTKMELTQNPLAETSETKSTTSQIKGEARFTQYLSKAFASENQIIDKIISQAKLRMNNGEKEITLQLSPPELGRVKIQLNESGGVMSGKIQVDSEVIKEIVQSNLHQLKASLNETIKIDKLDVEVRDDAEDQSLLQSFRNQDTQDTPGFKDRDKAYSDSYYEDDLQGSFGLETPLTRGLTQRENGVLSVDLFI